MKRLVDRIRPFYGRPSFRRLLVLNVVYGTSTSFVAPFMSMFGTLEAHMSLFLFGAFMTVNAVSGIAIATTLAHYSDVHFSRRAMLLAGGLAGAAGYAGYAYLRSFVPLVLVGSLVLGVSSITFSQLFAHARELLLESDIAPEQGAFYINVFRMFIALSWTVGPALAAWIMARFSFRGLFLCASADLLVFTSIVWLGVPATPSRLKSAGATRMPSLLALLARPDILAHFAAFVLITASATIGMMNLPLFILQTLRGTDANVGLAYSMGPIFELPFMLYFGWLATRRAPAGIIRLGMALSLAYYAALAWVTAPWHVYLCQAFAAAATSITAGVAITYFQGHMPRHPGTATNLYANAQRIGSTAGYLLFGAIAWRFGYRAVFEACALFAALALALMLVPVRALAAGVAALAVVLCSRPALAYRPFDGTDADVAALGDFELELGPVHWYTEGASRSLIAPATVLNLGYAPGWELVADFQNFVGLDTPQGQPRDRLLDTDLLTKAVIVHGVLQDAGPWPSVAAEFGPLLPNVNGESGFGASCDVIVSERVRGFAAHLNNWLELTRGSLRPEWFEGVILEGPVDLPVRPVTEMYVDYSWDTHQTTVSALAGAIWRTHENLDLDLGVRAALVDRTPVSEIRLGLTWTIGVWTPSVSPRPRP